MKRLLISGSILLTSFTLLGASSLAPRREDVPKYLEMLKNSPSGSDRALAADMLGRRGAISVKDVMDAVEPLRKALRSDTELKVRRASAKALGMIVPSPAEDTVPLLIETLADKDRGLRMEAVQALAAYGPEAKDALPPLRSLQKDATDKKDAKTIAAAIMTISQKMKKKG
jgi:HEAT repeat protein